MSIPTLEQLKAKLLMFNNNNPEFGLFFSDNNMTVLKAVDAVKDGATQQQAIRAFGVQSQMPSPLKLKADITTFFDRNVQDNNMTLLPYTRIKRDLSDDEVILDIHYDFFVHDCGPTYSRGNNKTPIVETINGD